MKTITVSNDDDKIVALEKTRFDAYQMCTKEEDYLNTYYARKLKDGNFLAFGSFKDDKLVAGCYVSSFAHALFIEQLFVKKEYQEKGLHIGRDLLQFVIDHKDIIESYFDCTFAYSKLEPLTNKASLIYQKMGYRKEAYGCYFSKRLH